MYVGSQFVHRSRDEGHSWQIISPDLTKNDKSHQQSSGGVAIDNLMTFDGATLFAIAESPFDEDLLWVGSNDGLLHITRDGGENWTDVTANIPDMPEWATVAMVEPSRYRGRQRPTSRSTITSKPTSIPIYTRPRTTETSWIEDLGRHRATPYTAFTHVIREDPKRPGMLYAGTDNAVWLSLDDGGNVVQVALEHAAGPGLLVGDSGAL